MTQTLREMRSVYWTLSPIYYVVRIFGLSPYSVVVKNNRARWSVSRSSLIYNTCFLITVLLCLFPLIEHIKDTIHHGKLDKLAMYSEFFRRVSGIVIATICVILSILNRHKTCILMKIMDDLDLDLSSYGIKVDYEETRQGSKTTAVATYLSLFVFVVMDSIVRINLIGEKSTQYWLASILLFGVSYSTVVQFAGLVLVLRKRFAVLNKYFRTPNDKINSKQLKNRLTSQGTQQKERTWRYINTEVPSKILSRNSMCTGATIATKYRTNPVSIVCDFHDRLCEWGKSLNSLYSTQILFITGMASVVVVIYLYVFYLMLSKSEKYELTFYGAWKPTIWGNAFFSMILLTSYVCAKTRDEANKICVVLHRINFYFNDDEARTFIEMFSLQMLHQKLEFSAGGFFAVNFSSLRTILVSITTYLLFFIQFEMAARESRTDKITP